MAYVRWFKNSSPWYVWWGQSKDAPPGSKAAGHRRSQTLYVWHVSQCDEHEKQIPITFGELFDDFSGVLTHVQKLTGCSDTDRTNLTKYLTQFWRDVEEREAKRR